MQSRHVHAHSCMLTHLDMYNTHEYVYTRVAYIRASVRTYRQTQNRQTGGQAAIHANLTRHYAKSQPATTRYMTLHHTTSHGMSSQIITIIITIIRRRIIRMTAGYIVNHYYRHDYTTKLNIEGTWRLCHLGPPLVPERVPLSHTKDPPPNL